MILAPFWKKNIGSLSLIFKKKSLLGMFQLKDTSNDPRRTRKPRQNGENWRRRSDQPWILLSKFAIFGADFLVENPWMKNLKRMEDESWGIWPEEGTQVQPAVLQNWWLAQTGRSNDLHRNRSDKSLDGNFTRWLHLEGRQYLGSPGPWPQGAHAAG